MKKLLFACLCFGFAVSLPAQFHAWAPPTAVWNDYTSPWSHTHRLGFTQIGTSDQLAGRALTITDEAWGKAGIAHLLFLSRTSGSNNSSVIVVENNTFGGQGEGKTFQVLASGQTFVGTSLDLHGNVPAGQGMLLVNGRILAEEVKVALNGTWPDYVFEPNYDLIPLKRVKHFIRQHRHLPGLPSENDILRENGFDLGSTTTALLRKIEELTLYAIDADEQIEALKEENREQLERLNRLEKRMAALETVH